LKDWTGFLIHIIDSKENIYVNIKKEKTNIFLLSNHYSFGDEDIETAKEILKNVKGGVQLDSVVYKFDRGFLCSIF
jgi:hypothetical protein